MFSRQEDPAALGLTRILVVAVLLVNVAAHLGAVGEYFSDESLIAGRFARLAFPHRASLFLPVDPKTPDVWYAGLYVADPTAVRVVFGVGLLAHVTWMLGLFTALSGLVSFGLWVSMVGRNPMLYAYPDQLCVMLAFLLALMPSGRGLSLDARWRGKGGTVPVWCRRILQFQLALVYVVTGLAKDGKTWHADGTALYYTLVNPYNRHFAMTETWAALQPWVLRPATWAVLLWEVGWAGFVTLHIAWEMMGRRRVPDLRKAWLGFGILMHGSVQVFLYTVLFSPQILAAYACFLMPDEVRRFVKWVAKRRKRRTDSE